MANDPLVVDTGNANTKDIEFIMRGEAVVAAFKSNPALANGWLQGMPNSDNLEEVLNRYRPAYVAARGGDSGKIRERKAIREEFIGLYRRVAHQVANLEIVNPGTIVAAGFKVKEPKQGGNNQRRTPKVPKPKVRHGKFPGSVEISFGRLAGAGSYNVQFTVGDPLLEESWKHGESSLHCSIVIVNLSVAERHYFRVCGIWAIGAGPWSEPISIIVV